MRQRTNAGRFVRSVLGFAFALAVLSGGPARAEILLLSEMRKGISISPADCATKSHAVWVEAIGRGHCIRYYLSTAGGDGKHPLVLLEGDQFGRLDRKSSKFEGRPGEKDVDTADLVKLATYLSRLSKGPGIYLARPGLDGSSGHHQFRHSAAELLIVNLALDAIRKRHGYEGFHLAGQSGGALLVGGLLGLRDDIACAVAGSGPLALPLIHWSSDLRYRMFNPADDIPLIAAKRKTRIFVVTDPEDKKVPAEHQTAFVTRLREAGGRATQFFVTATDENRHGVGPYAVGVASECKAGARDQQIAAKLERVVERRVADAARAKAAASPASNRSGGVQPACSRAASASRACT